MEEAARQDALKPKRKLSE